MLNEGLRKGDLDHMILPMISIDEFSSKIDDRTVIVVAFYCFEEDPAHDLSNFIERSPSNPLDTDVSPAPSREGYYVTFVEIKRNERFVERLMRIITEVSSLTDVQEWQFTSPKLDQGKVLSLTKENVIKWVDTKPAPVKPRKGANKEQMQEFLQHSSLSNFELEESQLMLMRGVQHSQYQVSRISASVPSVRLNLDDPLVLAEAARLERMLDGPYSVWPTQEGMVVENHHLESFLILDDVKY
jgi:hypothetical protein